MLQLKVNGSTADVQSISYQPGVGLHVIASAVPGDVSAIEAALKAAVGGGPIELEVQRAKKDKAK